MTRTLIIAAAIFAITPALRAESKEEALAKLQGKWRVERIEENGVAEPEEEAKRFTLIIKGNKINVELRGQVEHTDFQIDATKSPKEIDMVPQYGDDKGKTFRGIYEIDGDTLRICATPLAERPKKIVSEQGTMILILKRAKD
jgi:uncharacterized protein (TIGR03067 family)